MQIYSYSEARQNLAALLEQAEETGKVIIRRKDGQTFAVVPEKITASPLDVPSIKVNITTEELVDIIRNGRERENCRIRPSVSRDSPEGLLILSEQGTGLVQRKMT